MKRSFLLTLGIGAALTFAPMASAHAATTVSSQDKEFLQKSAAGDIFEIKGGEMAQQKGQSAQVKELGARLKADHTTSLGEARDLAKKLGVTLPSQPDAKMQSMLNQFSAASGAAFDRTYAQGEVSDHQEDIADATKEVNQGSNSSVKQNAAQELPILRTHLALSQQALSSVTGQTPSGVNSGSGGNAGQVPLVPTGEVALMAGAGVLLVGASVRRLRRDT
jgi:predicted outer membrane protein